MFRHMVRHVVKPGEYGAFVQSLKALNAALPQKGLPEYRAWVTVFGHVNEVWTEAEYESFDAHVAGWRSAAADDAFMQSFRAFVAHFVPGTLCDYPLAPVDLSRAQ